MKYDLAVVGSGIACTMALLELSKLLGQRLSKTGRKLQVVVIEKDTELWKGIAYGERSSINALAITGLRDFVSDSERPAFIEWLKRNQAQWLYQLMEKGGEAGAWWIKANETSMRMDEWDAIYLPRFVYGLFMTECLAAALQRLKDQGIAELRTIRAEVTSVLPAKDGAYCLGLEKAGAEKESLKAERVVLAIGSPPINTIWLGTLGEEQHHTYLNDVYIPSQGANLQRICETLSGVRVRAKRNILILGSNASSLEILYLIHHHPKIKALANSIVVLSRTGTLPHTIRDEDQCFEFPALRRLEEAKPVLSGELIAAIRDDVRRAETQVKNIADLFHPISAIVFKLLQKMTEAEQERFFCEQGMAFTKLMRRAGHEYKAAADELAASGKLSLEQGELRELRSSGAAAKCVSATYTRRPGRRKVTHRLKFALVVNCGGFEELQRSSSRLISSLISKKICSVNRTNRGFLVNERLEANKNLYVLGPLLGGNFNEKIRFWHAESAPRIHGVAKSLAKILFESISDPDKSAKLGSRAASAGSTLQIKKYKACRKSKQRVHANEH